MYLLNKFPVQGPLLKELWQGDTVPNHVLPHLLVTTGLGERELPEGSVTCPQEHRRGGGRSGGRGGHDIWRSRFLSTYPVLLCYVLDTCDFMYSSRQP